MDKLDRINVMEIVLNIFIFIVVILIIIVVTLLMLATLSPKNLCQSLCDYHNGIFYVATDCEGDTIACSGVCNFNNKSITCKELLSEINSTV